MFSHNKFLSFLIACTVANPCFAAGNSGTGQFLIFGSCNCPKNYYVSKCGDMDLDLNMILGQIQNIDPDGKCWNGDNYTNMHYLLHLKNNNKTTYEKSSFSDEESNILFYNSLVPWKNQEICSTQITNLTFLRTNDIYSACLSSCTCTKCPNDGVTDSETNVTTNDGHKFFENFNTIADCYIVSGSDDKGTFELFSDDDKCYYSYSE